MDVKEMLRARFAPVEANVTDPDLRGVLYIRRLRIPELREYLSAVRAGNGDDAQGVLMSLSVCDSDGKRLFDTSEEAEMLLGDLWMPIFQQCTALCFPDIAAGLAEKNSLPMATPPCG